MPCDQVLLTNLLLNHSLKITNKGNLVQKDIYFFNVNNENTKTMCKICSKLTIIIKHQKDVSDAVRSLYCKI